MSEAVFQTFLLLATFNIALISVTIANFAVSASYLGRETRLSRKRMERRKQDLLFKLEKMQKDVQIGDLKQEIRQAEKDISKLSKRMFLLSWVGAVILPTVFFVISFVSAMLGMNSESLTTNLQIHGFLDQQFIIFSSGTIALGFLVLLVVIKTIDSAARNIPVPRLDAMFNNRSNKIAIKPNQTSRIEVYISNNGEEIAEDVEAYLIVPSPLVIEPIGNQIVEKCGDTSPFPNCTIAYLRTQAFIYEDSTYSEFFAITAPHEKRLYEMPVWLYARRIGRTEQKLSIEVTD